MCPLTYSKRGHHSKAHKSPKLEPSQMTTSTMNKGIVEQSVNDSYSRKKPSTSAHSKMDAFPIQKAWIQRTRRLQEYTHYIGVKRKKLAKVILGLEAKTVVSLCGGSAQGRALEKVFSKHGQGVPEDPRDLSEGL